MSNQFLSSVSIVQANCAVGSTTGFVKESRNEVSVLDATKCTGVTSVTTTRTAISAKGGEGDPIKKSSVTSSCDVHCCNSVGKWPLEPLEKPWSLSKIAKHSWTSSVHECADKLQQGHETSAKTEVQEEVSAASNQKKKNAAGFLLEVCIENTCVEEYFNALLDENYIAPLVLFRCYSTVVVVPKPVLPELPHVETDHEKAL